MRRTIMASVLTFVLLGTFGLVANAQMAKEGTGSTTTMYSGTPKHIPIDKDHFVIIYQTEGVTVSDTGKGPFHNMSHRNVGIIYFEKGVGKLLGYIILTDLDGDKVLIEIREDKTQLPPAVNSGTGKYIHGTGKFSGIEGTMEYKRRYLRPATKETFQAISKAKGRWKLP